MSPVERPKSVKKPEKPKYAVPPLARGGLYVDPNFKPRLADRLGSVNTQYGVSEHWPKDIAPVFYPHVNNPLALGAMIVTPPAPSLSEPVREYQGEGETTLVEVPGGEGELLDGSPLVGPPGNSDPLLPGSSVRGKTTLGPPEGLLEPEAAVAPTARYGLTEVGGGGSSTVEMGKAPQEVSREPSQEAPEVIEATAVMDVDVQPPEAPTAPRAVLDETLEYEAPYELEGEGT